METIFSSNYTPVNLFLLILVSIKRLQGTILDRTSQSITDITTENIPPGTSQAKFSYNLLTIIPDDHFGSHPGLIFLFLDHNEISIVEDFAFLYNNNLGGLQLAFKGQVASILHFQYFYMQRLRVLPGIISISFM